MAITVVGTGSNQNKTSGTTLTLGSANVAVQVGDVVIATLAYDNSSATTPVVSTVAGGATGTWANIANINSPQSGGAAGVRTSVWRMVATGAGNVGLATTATLASSVTAKTSTFMVLRGVDNTSAPTVTSAPSTGNYSTAAIAAAAGGFVILGASTELATVPATSIAGTTPGSDTVVSNLTTGSTANTNVAQAMRGRLFATAVSGQAGAGTITDGAGYWLALTPAPTTHVAAGTVAGVGTTSGTLMPNPNAVDIYPLPVTYGSGQFTADVPAGYGLLIMSGIMSNGGGSVTSTVSFGGVTQSPVATFANMFAYLIDTGAGSKTVDLSATGSVYSAAFAVWAVSLKSGAMPTILDSAGAYSGGGGNFVNVDTVVNGALASFLVVSDGWFATPTYNILTTDYENLDSDGYVGGSTETTSTVTDQLVQADYAGGGVNGSDMMLAVSLQHATGPSTKQVAGTVAGTATTTGAPTGPDRAVESKGAGGATGTATVGLSYAQAYNSTHLLVAIVSHTQSATYDAGWTEVAAYGTTRIFVKQGDGVTTGFSMTRTSGAAWVYSMTIMAFTGYQSLTPVSATVPGTNIFSSVTDYAFPAVSSHGKGVSIFGVSGTGNGAAVWDGDAIWNDVPGYSSGTLSTARAPHPRTVSTTPDVNFGGLTRSGEAWQVILPLGTQPPLASGTVTTTSTVSGSITYRAAAGGTVAGVGSVSGSVTQRAAVSGTVAGVSVVSGDATRIAGPIPAAGTVSAVSTVSGSNTRINTPVYDFRSEDRLVRSKTVTFNTTDTTRTISFDEGTPLDSTHLLVLIVGTVGGVSITTPSGWTAGAGSVGTASGSIFARQGDGAANGVTVTTASTSGATLTLLAFQGFVSATPLMSNRTSTAGAGTVTTITSTAWEGDYGIAIGAIESDSPLTGSRWTTGYMGASSNEADTSQMYSSYMEWQGGVGITPSFWGLTHAYSTTQRRTFMALYPLTEVSTGSGTEPTLGTWAFSEGTGRRAKNFAPSGVDMVAVSPITALPWTASGKTGGGAVGVSAPSGAFAAINPARGATASDAYIYRGATIIPTFTIMAWIYVDAYPSVGVENQNIAVADDFGLLLGVNNAGKLTSIYSQLVGTTSLPIGQWSHVALVADGPTGNAKFFVNGVEDASTVGLYRELGNRLQIGGYWATGAIYGTGMPFMGRVDDVRLLDTQLSGAQLTTWMNTPAGTTAHVAAGSVTGISTVAGVTTKLTLATGTLDGLSTTLGTLTLRSAAAGTVVGTGATSGAVSKLTLVQGTVAGIGTAVGAAKLIGVTSGTPVAGLSVVSGAPTKRTQAVSTVQAVGTSSGSAALVAVAAGTVQGISTVVGSAANTGTLYGTVTVTSGVAGALTQTLVVSGTNGSTGTISGAVTSLLPTSGTVSVSSVVTGDPTKATASAGTVAAVSTVSGAPYNLAPVSSGPISSVSLTYGAVTNRRALSGTVAGVSTTGTTPTKRTAVSGTVSGVSTTSATPIKRTSAGGTVSGVSATLGSATRGLAMDGSIEAVSDVTGEPILQIPLDGVFTAESTVSGGVVSGNSLLAPAISADSNLTGEITANFALDAEIVGTSEVSGDVIVVLPASGRVDATSNTLGMPTSRLRVTSGAVVGVGTASGTVVTRRVAAGTVVTVSTVSGATAGESAAEGVVAVTSGIAGEIRKVSDVDGVVEATGSIAEASVSGSRAVEGAVEGIGEVTGQITRKRQMSGTVVGHSTTAGNATPEGSTSGTIAVVSSIVSVIPYPTKRTVTGGTVNATSEISGEITRTQPLSGTVASISEVSGEVSRMTEIYGVVVAQTEALGEAIKEAPVEGTVAVNATVMGSLSVTSLLSLMMGGQEIPVTPGMVTYKVGGVEYSVGLGSKLDGAESAYWPPG